MLYIITHERRPVSPLAVSHCHCTIHVSAYITRYICCHQSKKQWWCRHTHTQTHTPAVTQLVEPRLAFFGVGLTALAWFRHADWQSAECHDHARPLSLSPSRSPSLSLSLSSHTVSRAGIMDKVWFGKTLLCQHTVSSVCAPLGLFQLYQSFIPNRNKTSQMIIIIIIR